MPPALQNIKVLIAKYPMLKGMLSYSLIWPTSSLIQQTMIENKKVGEIEWMRVLRFSLYGGLFVAPTLYSWIRLTSIMWPKNGCLKTGLIKAAVEQFSYTPAAMACFYFLMSLLEMKTLREAADEVGKKFWPTYKVGVSVWPIVATINFTLIPEANRVPFISVCSLIWTCFLAYMKQRQHHEFEDLQDS